MIYKTKIAQIEVELKDYITGREFQQIQDLFLDGSTMGEGNKMVANTKAFAKVQDKIVEIVVVSVGGVRENILDAVLDLRQEDYTELVAKASEITNGLTEEKKTT